MTRCARRSSRCVGRRTRRKHQHMSSAESKEERLDRELIELLNELRVALPGVQVLFAFLLGVPFTQRFEQVTELQDRKSTRLNSSHTVISYAVFCLKKKRQSLERLPGGDGIDRPL